MQKSAEACHFSHDRVLLDKFGSQIHIHKNDAPIGRAWYNAWIIEMFCQTQYAVMHTSKMPHR